MHKRYTSSIWIVLAAILPWSTRCFGQTTQPIASVLAELGKVKDFASDVDLYYDTELSDDLGTSVQWKVTPDNSWKIKLITGGKTGKTWSTDGTGIWNLIDPESPYEYIYY